MGPARRCASRASASQHPKARAKPYRSAAMNAPVSMPTIPIPVESCRRSSARSLTASSSRRRPRSSSTAPMLASVSSFSAGVPASRRQASSIDPAGPTDKKSPGRVSSTASRNAASSSTRPACFAVTAAAESASRCRQVPAPRSCLRTTASSAPMAAPAASATSSRAFSPTAFPARLCASGTARRSQAGTVAIGAVEAGSAIVAQ